MLPIPILKPASTWPKSKPGSPADNLPVPVEVIERRIYLIRGQKVMLDSDLANLYQVETKALNRAVQRNADRFPEDFMLQLTTDEAESLDSSEESVGEFRLRQLAK